MQALFAVLLAIIAALLFYRLVERRHKILFAKALGGAVTLTLIIAGAWLWQHQRSQRREGEHAVEEFQGFLRDLSALKVSFVAASSGRDTARVLRHMYPDRLAFQVCNTSVDTIDSFTINASTWDRGHSEKRSVLGERPSRLDELKSDVVLVPKACTLAVFYGNYVIRDSVYASATPKFRSR